MNKTIPTSIIICGIPFDIEQVDVIDESEEGIIQGKIYHTKCKILLKRSLPEKLKKSVLYHEILHGILILLGYDEESSDETFVQSLSNAMYQMFEIKEGSNADSD